MKKHLFKKIIGVVLITGLLGSLAGCGNASTNKDTSDSEVVQKDVAQNETSSESDVPKVVNIGVQTLITPELITRYEKSYEDYLGTKVNLVQFDSGADVNKAFSSGSIDIGAFGSAPASIGIANNLGYEVFWYYDVIGTAESLVATENSGIKTVEDLKGKKVATPFASTAHYSLLNAMKLAGISSADVELLDMQPDDIYAAWKRGDIDAAYVWNPVLGELKKDGGIAITDSGELAKEGIVTADVAAVNKEFAAKYPNVVTNYVKAQLHALDVYENDKDTAIKSIAAVAGIDEDEASSQVEDFTYPSGEEQITEDYLGTTDKKGALAQTLKNTADFLVEQGSIKSAPDLSVFEDNITGEYIEKALNERK